MKGPISCHGELAVAAVDRSLTTTVLDVALGKPAEGVHVSLQVYRDRGDFGVFDPVSQQSVHFLSRGPPLTPPLFSVTDTDGRCMKLLPPRDSEGAKQAPQFQIAAGVYKIVFKPQEYFEKTGRKCFYPWVEVANPTRTCLFLADRPTHRSHSESKIQTSITTFPS